MKYKNILLIFTTLVALLTTTAVQADDALKKGLVVRTEVHPIQTMTLTDEQFLQGKNGTNVTIAGVLQIAQGTGRLPVAILIHGSGGAGGNIDMWARDFHELGISTFVIDGFSGRGLTTGTSTNQASLGRLNFVLDIYRSLQVLSKNPRVDTSRIVLYGSSRGGQAALYASVARFQTLWNKSGIDIAAYLPFYPDCSTHYIDDEKTTGSPIRIFGGAMDDYNPISKCILYVEKLKAAGQNVELIEYPAASHSFDNPFGTPNPTVAKNAQTVRNCTISEESTGRLINQETGKAFTYQDSCVELNPSTGFDEAATVNAKLRVAQFLAKIFKLSAN